MIKAAQSRDKMWRVDVSADRIYLRVYICHRLYNILTYEQNMPHHDREVVELEATRLPNWWPGDLKEFPLLWRPKQITPWQAKCCFFVFFLPKPKQRMSTALWQERNRKKWNALSWYFFWWLGCVESREEQTPRRRKINLDSDEDLSENNTKPSTQSKQSLLQCFKQ